MYILLILTLRTRRCSRSRIVAWINHANTFLNIILAQFTIYKSKFTLHLPGTHYIMLLHTFMVYY